LESDRPVPLDEYETYVGPVATILQKAWGADASLGQRSNDDPIEGERNGRRAAAVGELAAYLAAVGASIMGSEPVPADELKAAVVLLDWYWEEMYLLEQT